MNKRLIDNKIDYKFFNRSFQESNGIYFNKDGLSQDMVNNNRLMVMKEIGASSLLLLNQKHGAKVHKLYDIYECGDEPEADAIVTKLPNIAIGIITADCVPVLYYCTETQVVGASHCGWKSARADIINNVFNEMVSLGAENICAIIGPSIQQNSYEVSTEFYEDFFSESNENSKFFIKKEDKFLFDLPSYVESKLEKVGIKVIEKSKDDTYSNPEKYPSRRRSFHMGQDYKGNILSTIMIKQ